MGWRLLINSDNFILYLASFLAGLSVTIAISGWIISSSYKKSRGPYKQVHANGTDLHTKSKANGFQHENGVIKKANRKQSADDIKSNQGTVKATPSNDDLLEKSKSSIAKCIERSVAKKLHDLSNQETIGPLAKANDFSAIVLTDENNLGWSHVICITSGSGVIDAKYLEAGSVVIDCRAAVLSRRCFLRFLYTKLIEMVTNRVNENDSIFELIPASNRFQLKSNLKVNLFLNQSLEAQSNSQINSTAENIINIKSVADKISLWSQVGLQGSILSHFLEPIYLNTVVSASDFNENWFNQHFIINYTQNPNLMKCAKIRAQINEESAKFEDTSTATNWLQTEDYVELINCSTGKALSGDGSQEQIVSRLSKYELNQLLRNFLSHYEHRLRLHQKASNQMNYRWWKQNAPNYRIQKQLLKVRYVVAERQWKSMPSTLDEF